jgi:hypothetical protein
MTPLWRGMTRAHHSRAALVTGMLALVIALSVQFWPASGRQLPVHALGLYTEPVSKTSVKDNSHESVSSPSQEQYDNRALPNSYIDYSRAVGAQKAFAAIPGPTLNQRSWLEVGPFRPNVSSVVSYTQRATQDSGRITALAIDPNCSSLCRVWIGSAGGGIWSTTTALGTRPQWISSSNGLTSNAIGSLLVDPTDPTGNTLYAGTGEANGSGDSEAGVGLFKSTNGGQSWSLVPGSVPVSKDRSIAAIAVDPINPMHIFIGTALARHGSGAVNGGRFTPPGAPTLGVYESTNGGTSFSLVLSKPQDVVIPAPNPNGGDFFRGGVSNIELDRNGLTSSSQPTKVYASLFDYGLFRRDPEDDGNTAFNQVFAAAGGGSPAQSQFARTEFALAPMSNGHTRIYLGDATSAPANFYRTDNANVPAASVVWITLSNPTPGTPGFASYNYCDGQCSYDMPIASPAGQPDTVVIGGSYQYGEAPGTTGPPLPSNGRTEQRSTDAGVHFQDMTRDTQTGPCGPLGSFVSTGCPEGMHPDQHAIVFDPSNPNVIFFGDDGGITRTDGAYVDRSADCSDPARALSGADLTDCQMWLSGIPNMIYNMNDSLRTLQFQGVSVNPNNPINDFQGGTQDNGTWEMNSSPVGTETVGGDGGLSGINVLTSNIRFHTYFDAVGDVNFHTGDPLQWDFFTGPMTFSGERQSFYIPIIYDPNPSQANTIFAGLQHVWRTQDNGGPESYLDPTCNELTGTGPFFTNCGDFVKIGPDLTSAAFGDKALQYVVAVSRTPSDTSTLWAGTRIGRVWISHNANAAPASVTFTRIDKSTTPSRFVSGIVIDPANSNHAWISFEGYNAYNPTQPGHVFDVLYNPVTHTATWTNISYNIGDMPITGIQRDDKTGDLYAATDFGVIVLPAGSTTWQQAAPGIPPVAVYQLTIDSSARVLYAATHGRGIWRLYLK